LAEYVNGGVWLAREKTTLPVVGKSNGRGRSLQARRWLGWSLAIQNVQVSGVGWGAGGIVVGTGAGEAVAWLWVSGEGKCAGRGFSIQSQFRKVADNPEGGLSGVVSELKVIPRHRLWG